MARTRQPRSVAPAGAAPDRLATLGWRRTRPRLALADLLFPDGAQRHVTPEQLFAEATALGLGVSRATVYNLLRQLTIAGELREIVLEGGRSWFDTNVRDHFHFLVTGTEELIDLPDGEIDPASLPPLPRGIRLRHVNAIIHVTEDHESQRLAPE